MDPFPLLVGLATVILGAVLSVPVLSRYSGALTLLWLVSVLCVPYWVTPLASPFVPISTVIGVFAACGLLARCWSRLRLCVADVLVIVSALMMVLAATVGWSEPVDVVVILSQWYLPYLAGRALFARKMTDRVVLSLSLFGGLLGVLSVLEFALDFHPFTQLENGSLAGATWSWIQYRGGLPRSEWTLGHSIALGNVLAMCAPFALMCRLDWGKRMVLLFVITLGVACTFSRNALLALFVSIALVVLIQLRPQQRVLAGLGLTGGLALANLLLGSVFASASDETSASSDYRLLMLDLLGQIRALGGAGTYVYLSDGNMGYESMAYPGGAARSIDNTFVLMGLRVGWIPMLCVVGVIVFVALRGLIATRGPASISVVAQIPTLMTVAMITQYSSFYWALMGFAASAGSRATAGNGGNERVVGEISPKASAVAVSREFT